MTSDEQRQRRVQAGQWLREQRQRRGYATAAEFARALDVDKGLVSNYETGRTSVTDDRAEVIAEVLDRDVITVRRNLGLWVPPDESPAGDEGGDESGEEDPFERMDRLYEEWRQDAEESEAEALRAVLESYRDRKTG